MDTRSDLFINKGNRCERVRTVVRRYKENVCISYGDTLPNLSTEMGRVVLRLE